ncbi:MAG: hypothetical protein JWP00_3803 [Chloroflexi bacterium]|jgi:hypothetical protein|nr:hypothetical protein [Chloroflexota bacterium]
MADQSMKQATCPLCGFTDSAGDREALELSMQEHMRLMHNQVMSADPSSMDLKDTGKNISDDVPVGPATELVAPPNTNAGNFGQFPAPRGDIDIPEKD